RVLNFVPLRRGKPERRGWIILKILKSILVYNNIKLNPPPALRATSSKGGQKLKLQNSINPPPPCLPQAGKGGQLLSKLLLLV
ncbi:hypothetical protein EBU71_12495, partial [bacterium]|nr:hypothetical protein [Candidatus Elulimicrobium humile]